MNYNIIGEPFPAVVCTLNADESMITERGSMCWMSPNMKMETTSNGGIGKVFGRMFSGESMFQNRYTAVGGTGTIAFASSFPGSVRCFDITPNNPLIVQKSGFLASESTVELSVHFQKRFGAGLFGGEIDGHAVEYDLRPGQSIVVDTGYLAAMSASCTMDIQTVRGVKNVLFGGEGFFNTVVTGPGKVLLQTMPINAVAGSIAPYIPSGGKN